MGRMWTAAVPWVAMVLLVAGCGDAGSADQRTTSTVGTTASSLAADEPTTTRAAASTTTASEAGSTSLPGAPPTTAAAPTTADPTVTTPPQREPPTTSPPSTPEAGTADAVRYLGDPENAAKEHLAALVGVDVGEVQVVARGPVEITPGFPCGTSAKDEEGPLPGGIVFATELVLTAGDASHRYVAEPASLFYCGTG